MANIKLDAFEQMTSYLQQFGRNKSLQSIIILGKTVRTSQKTVPPLRRPVVNAA
jgi:hypothetical protein